MAFFYWVKPQLRPELLVELGKPVRLLLPQCLIEIIQ